MLEELDKNFFNQQEQVFSVLEKLIQSIFRKENCFIDYTGTKEGYELLEKKVDDLTSALFQSPLDIKPFQLALEKKNEGFKT